MPFVYSNNINMKSNIFQPIRLSVFSFMCSFLINSLTIAEPAKPEPPATKTAMNKV